MYLALTSPFPYVDFASQDSRLRSRCLRGPILSTLEEAVRPSHDIVFNEARGLKLSNSCTR